MSTKHRLARLEKQLAPRAAVEGCRSYWRERNDWVAAFILGEVQSVPVPPGSCDPSQRHATILRITACLEARWCGLIRSDEYLLNMTPDDKLRVDRAYETILGIFPTLPDGQEDLTKISDEELKRRIADLQERIALEEEAHSD